MSEERQNRIRQFETLMKTVVGRERIVDAYHRVCQSTDSHTPSIPEMVEAILEAEFPSDGQPKT